jgi:uncharacterized protein (TIRG00374 family)
MQKSQRLKLLSQIGVSLTIAVILFVNLDIKQVYVYISTASMPVLVLVFLILVPALLLRSYRWKLLFNNNVYRIKQSESTALLLVGMALNLILPATSGDIVKSYFGYKWSGVKERMLSISALDKVIALASISVLGIPFALYQGNSLYGGLSMLVLLPAVILLSVPWLAKNTSFFRKVFHYATKAIKGKLDFLTLVDEVNVSSTRLFHAFVISILGWTLTYLQMYLCFRSIDAFIPLSYVFSVAPLITLVRLFPFALSGIGSDELALYFLFRQAGATMEEILSAAVIYRSVVLILPGLAGLLIIAITKRMGGLEDTQQAC